MIRGFFEVAMSRLRRSISWLSLRRPVLGKARQGVMNVEPGKPARGVDVVLRLDRLGMIERREIDVDLARVLGDAEGELRAAGAAEAPERLLRGAVGNGLSGGDGEVRDRHDQPGDDGSAPRPLAHPAMTRSR